MRPYEAFFTPQHQRSLGRYQEIINTIIDATHESIQVHINLMRSQVVKSDGTITIIHDLYERRVAAKTLISKAVEFLALHQDDQDQAGGDVKMIENRVRKSGNGSQEKNNGTWRYLFQSLTTPHLEKSMTPLFVSGPVDVNPDVLDAQTQAIH